MIKLFQHAVLLAGYDHGRLMGLAAAGHCYPVFIPLHIASQALYLKAV
ncbi:hypothetical protein B4099_1125 [Heyndrickxia coagulans]|uniref:Uncharacterized protein n=1 Tax=Heyndrickxia coagulans TaxID=1398 RepID=A0A150KFX3_HEYCO|nr:hypothetical protein B4099_1125 [Heyndrickxia coagulans]